MGGSEAGDVAIGDQALCGEGVRAINLGLLVKRGEEPAQARPAADEVQ